MKKLLQRLARSLVPTTRALAMLFAVAAATGAWAAAGDTVTICNDLSTGGFATSTPTYTANDSYTITIPAVSGLSAGDYVRVTSFSFGRNSSGDTMNVAYVTSKDFLGDTIRSGNRTESGKFSKITAWKEICAFGSAGDDNDLLLKVGMAYDFSLLNSSGAKTEQKVLAFTTTDGTYSPVAQDTTSTGTRMEQEVVCKVVSSAVVSASGTWSGLAFSNAPGDWSAATTAPVLVELTADSTLEINTDVNVESIVFAVPANVTLTLTGSKAITATTAISIKGGGSVCVAAGADVLSGPVKVASGTTFTFDFDNVAAPTEENPFGDALLAACSFSVLGSAQFSNVPANTIASIGDCGIRLVHNSVFGKWNATGQSMYAWRSAGTSGNFSACSVAPVTTSSGAVGGTETIAWGKFCNGNGSYSAPAPAFYFDSTEYSMQRTPNFSPLTIGGLLVTAGGSTIERSDGQLELGDTRSTDAKIETYFVLAQSFGLGSFGKGGSYPNKIYGTVNIEAVEGATLTLPSQGITLDTATAANLKMHGAGNIALTGTITATGNVTLDYSDVDSGNTFIRGSLTVDASTKLVLPSWLSEGTPYTLCTGTLTAPSMVTEGSVQIGDGEATTATLLYNTTAKTVTYYTSIPEFTGTVSESTITWDSEPTQEQYAIGKIVLTGSGDVTLPYEPLAINAGSDVTVDVTGYTTAVYSGAGTFKFRDGYPVAVPAGMVYQFVGSGVAETPTAIAGVTVAGTLKTSGYVSLASLVVESTGTLDVLSDITTVSTTTRSNGAGNLSGAITIEPGATMVNSTVDGLDWAGTTVVKIYGTLSMGATRWSIRDFDNCEINLYPGAQVTGTGDGNGVFDLFDGTSKLNVYHGEAGGTATISGPVRFRNANTKYPIWIASGTTLELSGGTLGNGGFSMNGAGELKLSGTMGHIGASQVQDGTVTLDNIATAIPITVNAGKTLAVIATEAETVVPINATIAATGSIISSSGSGKVSGNIGFSNFSASQLNSNASGTLGAFLSGSSWTGTVTVPVHNTTSTEQVYLANLGNSNSTIVLNGLSGNTHWIGDGSFPAELKIVGNVTFNNGGSGMNAEIGKVSGTDSTKTLTVAAWANCTGATYTINDLSEFEGAISVNGSNLSSGTFKLVIGNITKASYSYGTALVTCSTTPGTHGTTTIDLSNTTLNNTAANLVFDTDGIYLAEAAYNGANYKTLSAAVSAAEAASAAASAVTVYNSAATIPSGYALVKAAGGTMTLRSAGSGELIYWASSNPTVAWGGESSNGSFTFYTTSEGTATTTYTSDDTVVFTRDTHIFPLTGSYGAKYKVTNNATLSLTRSGDSGNGEYVLSGSTVTIDEGATLKLDRYGTNGTWDSYELAYPDAHEVYDTTISGEGTLLVSANSLGAASLQLLGTSTVSSNVEIADGATVVVSTATSSVAAPTMTVASGTVTLDVTDSLTVTSNEKLLGWTTFSGEGTFVAGETLRTKLGTYLQLGVQSDGVYVQGLGLGENGTGGYLASETLAIVTNAAANALEIPASVTMLWCFPVANDAEIALETGSGLTMVSVYATGGMVQDLSKYFTRTIDKTTDNKVTITLNAESVRPTIAAGTVTVDDDEVACVEVTSDAEPVFSLTTIPGFWYGVSVSTDGSTFAVDEDTVRQATATSLTLPAASTPTTVKYYKIAVGASKASLK